jgi:hypothetical protein
MFSSSLLLQLLHSPFKKLFSVLLPVASSKVQGSSADPAGMSMRQQLVNQRNEKKSSKMQRRVTSASTIEIEVLQ